MQRNQTSYIVTFYLDFVSFYPISLAEPSFCIFSPLFGNVSFNFDNSLCIRVSYFLKARCVNIVQLSNSHSKQIGGGGGGTAYHCTVATISLLA